MKHPFSYVTLECKEFNPSHNVLPLRVEVMRVEVGSENNTIVMIIASAWQKLKVKLKVIW